MTITVRLIAMAVIACFGLWGCSSDSQQGTAEVQGAEGGGGQSTVQDAVSTPDILHVAIGSPDHTTLVKAVQAAELENALANAGPFTVFAPTDAAFAKVPEETLADLMKPENKELLANILYHHVQVSTYTEDRLRNTSKLMLFDGSAEDVTTDGDDIIVGGAKILGRVNASNGIVYVVDSVILPD